MHVLILEVSSFRGPGRRCTVAYYTGLFGSSDMCPSYRGVSAIQGTGVEESHCTPLNLLI